MHLYDLHPGPSDDTRWCCLPFRSMVEFGGSRGLAIIIGEGSAQSKKYVFYIQMRATNADQKFTAVTNVPVALHMNLHIDFCPWSGKNLHRFYARASLPVHPELIDLD